MLNTLKMDSYCYATTFFLKVCCFRDQNCGPVKMETLRMKISETVNCLNNILLLHFLRKLGHLKTWTMFKLCGGITKRTVIYLGIF